MEHHMSDCITVFYDTKRGVYSAAIVNSDGWSIEECPFRKTKAEAESDARKLGRETGIFVVGQVYDENGEPTLF
jgi:hypothetical protein